MVASAGAAGVVDDGVLVADVAVVPAVVVAVAVAAAVSLPTLHRGIHSTCCQSGEDTSHTQGTGGNQGAVQRRWVDPKGLRSAPRARTGPRKRDHEPHVIQ